MKSPRIAQTQKPFQVKEKPIWGKGIGAAYHKTKTNVNDLLYLDPKMKMREILCLRVRLGRRKDEWDGHGQSLDLFQVLPVRLS